MGVSGIEGTQNKIEEPWSVYGSPLKSGGIDPWGMGKIVREGRYNGKISSLGIRKHKEDNYENSWNPRNVQRFGTPGEMVEYFLAHNSNHSKQEMVKSFLEDYSNDPDVNLLAQRRPKLAWEPIRGEGIADAALEALAEQRGKDPNFYK